MQQAAGKGKMAAVGLSMEETEKVLAGYQDRLFIAAVNSPASTVLSGEPAALEEVLKRLRQRNIFCRMLRVNYAFHCPQMDPFREELAQALQGLDPQPASISIFSTVTGRAGDGKDFDAAYWGKNIRYPVRFAAAVDGLIKEGGCIFLEISPHPVLTGEISQCLEHRGQEGSVLSCLCRGSEERVLMLGTLGKLYTLGYPINWSNLYPDGGRCVGLPSYPWQRKRYRVETAKPGTRETLALPGERTTGSLLHPLLNHRLSSPLKEILFQSQFSVDSPFFLDEHRFFGMVVFPAAAYLEMALAAAAEALGPGPHAAYLLEDVVIHEALTLPGDAIQTVQLILSPGNPGEVSFRIFSLTASTEGEHTSWRLLGSGKIRTGSTGKSGHVSIEELQAQSRDEWSVREYYQGFREHGIEYGASFQAIEKLWRQDGEAVGRIRLPEKLVPESGGYYLHPVLLDACFQLFAAALPGKAKENSKEGIYMPFALESFRVHTRPGTRLWGHALLRPGKPLRERTTVGDFILFNEKGEVAAEIMGVMFNRASREVLARTAKEGSDNWLYRIEWKPKARVESRQAKKEIQPDRQGSWLIFSDRGGVGVSLAELLQELGESYVMVFPGEAYEISKNGHFKINPSRSEDFHRLLKEAYGYGDAQHQPPCRKVVHLWSLDAGAGEETTISSLEAAQVLSSGSVLHLVQALAAAELSVPPRLWLVTRGAQPVGSEMGPGSLSVAQAPLWGLGNVIALEHPELHPVRVDLDPLGEADDGRTLFGEILSQDKEQDREQEDQIAFRLGERYVRRLVFHDSSPPGAPGAAAVFRPDGTYLITGGLGGLGLTAAQWMVEQGARHLVLMGRRGASTAAREVLDTMSKTGARVVVVKADVTQEEQVASVLAEISQSMPPLKGIFHAAGVLEDGLLVQQKWEDFVKVMAPKVAGAWILHTLTRDMELDFFVLFSSAASLLGWWGQGNYAAGNAFLDGLAHHRQDQGLAALSINWGPWAEVGMAADSGSRGMRRWRTMGINMIAPEQGLQVLGQMLGQLTDRTARVTVLPIKWSTFNRQIAMRGALPPLFSEVARGLNPEVRDDQALKRQTELLRRLETAPAGDRRNILADYIRGQVADVLGFDSSYSLKPHQGLFELGMDSITAVELKNRLEVGLGRSLPAVLTFNYPTIEALVEYLAEEVLFLESTAKPGVDSREDTSIRTRLFNEIKQLSQEEVEALIDEELETLKRGE
jgi:malonyl CoA-acyl carrier protein transacylase/NAD(P)-dependent dehydrogenase (short-subunit alcohol dehydrogenase family)